MNTQTKSKTKIYLVDHHAIFREGLTLLLKQQKDFDFCGGSANGDDALSQIKSLRPDLIVVEVALPGISGLELTRRIRSSLPAARILVLSTQPEELYAERALRAGANGYIMKQASGEELVIAIRQLLRGQSYLSKELNQLLIQRVAGSGRKVKLFAMDLLSDRELEVFQRVGQGFSTRDIADELHVSMKTVEAHKEHIRTKLNLSTNSELVQHAIHWVHSEPGALDISKKLIEN